MKFKAGDKVKHTKSGRISFVKEVPGMASYDKVKYGLAEMGFISKEDTWEYQCDWHILGIEITILGNTPSKKNQKQMARTKDGRMFPVVSKIYRAWHAPALEELKRQVRNGDIKPIFGPIKKVVVTIYPNTLRKADVSNKLESVMDILVDAGILEDDNWFIVPHIEGFYGGKDKENPRATCILYPEN